MLPALSNSQLAKQQSQLTERYGQLMMWIADAERKIYDMICTNVTMESLGLQHEVDLKFQAEIEKYKILSQLKQIEIEMEKRVNGSTEG
jgi:hypothetical protein